jgi:hypothetical protein
MAIANGNAYPNIRARPVKRIVFFQAVQNSGSSKTVR